jgi:hypothetical protein
MVARNRLVLSGTIADGNEVWSIGFNFAIPDVGSATAPQDVQDWAQAAALEASSWFATGVLSEMLSTAGTFDKVECYGYGPTGPALAIGEAILTAPEVGSGAVNCPSYVSAVASLRTGLFGARYRGRVYLPAMGVAIGANGQYAGTTTGPNISTAVSGLIQDLAAAAPGALAAFPVVYSPTGDLVTAVTSVLVGSVPDVQRRRKDDIQEVYASAPYPPA